jgi:hypothetical protein
MVYIVLQECCSLYFESLFCCLKIIIHCVNIMTVLYAIVLHIRYNVMCCFSCKHMKPKNITHKGQSEYLISAFSNVPAKEYCCLRSLPSQVVFPGVVQYSI